jgi:hypothetical protein
MIDAEGSELDVLEGMTEVLKVHRPVVVCEIHWLGNEFRDFVTTRLDLLGYSVTSLERGIPSETTRWHALLRPRTTRDV